MRNYLTLLVMVVVLPRLFSQPVPDQRAQMEEFRAVARQYYYKADFDNAITSWKKALIEARLLQDVEWQARFMSSIAVGNKRLGKYGSAILYNDSAIDLASSIENTSVLAACYNTNGTIYLEKGMLSKAQENFIKAKELKEALNDTCSLASTMLNLGEIRNRLKDMSRAREYYNQSLNLRRSCADTFGIISCYINLGIVARNQNDTVSAYNYYKDAEKLAQTNPEKYLELQVVIYENIAQLMLNQKQYNKSIALHHTALGIAEEYDLVYDQTHALNQIGIAKYHQNQLSEASDFSFRAHQLAVQAGILEKQMEAVENLVDVYQTWRKPSEAAKWLAEYKVLKDSLLNATVMESIFDIGAKQEILDWQHKTDLVQAELTDTQTELEQSESRNTIYMLAVGLLIIVLAGSTLLVRQSNRRKSAELRAEKAERRKVELQTENLEKKLEIERQRKVIVLNHRIKDEPEKFLYILGFTNKEMELIRIWFQKPGITEENIANQLSRSRDTVKSHGRNIREKLDASNREEAMAKMIDMAYQHILKTEVLLN